MIFLYVCSASLCTWKELSGTISILTSAESRLRSRRLVVVVVVPFDPLDLHLSCSFRHLTLSHRVRRPGWLRGRRLRNVEGRRRALEPIRRCFLLESVSARARKSDVVSHHDH